MVTRSVRTISGVTHQRSRDSVAWLSGDTLRDPGCLPLVSTPVCHFRWLLSGGTTVSGAQLWLSSAFVFFVHSPSFCWLCPCVDSFSLLIKFYNLFLSLYFHFFLGVGGCISFCRAERMKMFLVPNRSTFVLCPLFGKVSKFCPTSYTFKDNFGVSLCTILLIHLCLSLPICLFVYIITSN